MQWPSALCYASYEEKREGRERRDNIHTFEKNLAAKSDSGSLGVWRFSEGGVNTWHVPYLTRLLGPWELSERCQRWLWSLARPSRGKLCEHPWPGGGQRENGQKLRPCVFNPDEFRLCSGPSWGGLHPEMHLENESWSVVIIFHLSGHIWFYLRVHCGC